MKSYLLSLLILAAPLVACNNDDPAQPDTPITDAADLDYTSEYAASWANYSRNVAALLKSDAATLRDKWTGGFAQQFASGSWSGSYNESVQQIFDGCIDIANEVGTAKIGEPYDYFIAGQTTTAVYAVESWYSWHSRDDYANNIRSIANSLLGVRASGALNLIDPERDGHPDGLYAYCSTLDAERAAGLWRNVVDAWSSIQTIPQPFRNNINSAETVAAMDACERLTTSLEEMKALVASRDDEAHLRPIVERYVYGVVVPTYEDLAQKNAALYDAVVALGAHPSDDTFAAACEAWLNAREPWETSEAFLFGPVDELGLDPNMDSWPLDQDAIVKILTSGDYSRLDWTDADSDDAIEAAQSLRGFHTLEFLLFKNGQPRRVK